jgi:glycosyltransferase involved in cell wall biosynthesis
VKVVIQIPCYNEAEVLPDTLRDLPSSIPGVDEIEIMVIDDGSTDGTADVLAAHAGGRITTLRLPANLGKFAALKAGMAAADGACRVFTDADLPYDLEAIPYMTELVTSQGFHLVVGDRTLAGSELGSDQPGVRRLSTRVFSFSVRMLVTGELFDTQVGLKAFRGDVADGLFPLITDDGFAGDVELLYVALKYNLAIRRIPVRLRRRGPTTVSLLGHSLPMLARIAGLRRGWSTGRYESPGLRAISNQRYWIPDTDG